MSAARGRRNNRLLGAFAVLGALALLAASRIHVNGSWSDEAWGYVLLPLGTPARGDLVIFQPPESLGAAAPYLKSVAGVPGDRIAVDANRGVWIGERYLGRAKRLALDGRPLEALTGGAIPPGQYFLHADHKDSHDSRYAEIGLVPRGRIRGRAVALPDMPRLGLRGPLVSEPAERPIETASAP